MYNTIQDSYQTASNDYALTSAMYKSVDSLVGNYSSNKPDPIKSDFLKFATSEPFNCSGCDYHNH
jgi:hypothetical protein